MKQPFGEMKTARLAGLLILAALICALTVIALSAKPTAASDTESRMCAILSSIDGAGRVRVMLSENASGECTGAVIAAEGADDVRVRLEIQRAVRTLTGLTLNKIEVVRSGG